VPAGRYGFSQNDPRGVFKMKPEGARSAAAKLRPRRSYCVAEDILKNDLMGMLRRINKNIRVRPLEDLASLKTLREALSK